MQGEGRQSQAVIEQHLGMTHTMFKHIVALNTYTDPFLSMRANDQREMIEQLLGITKLSEKADILELAEEQMWTFFCDWQGVKPDVEISYPDSFDIRDYEKELTFLQQLKASGIRSATLTNEVDKQIADLVLDDDVLDKVSAITPVPGGVGPMTISMLLVHTVQACKNLTN